MAVDKLEQTGQQDVALANDTESEQRESCSRIFSTDKSWSSFIFNAFSYFSLYSLNSQKPFLNSVTVSGKSYQNII